MEAFSKSNADTNDGKPQSVHKARIVCAMHKMNCAWMTDRKTRRKKLLRKMRERMNSLILSIVKLSNLLKLNIWLALRKRC